MLKIFNTYESQVTKCFILTISTCFLFTILMSTGFGADKSVLTDMNYQKANTPIVKTNKVCDEFVKRLRTIPFKPGNIIISELGFAKSRPSETYESNECILKSISKDYSLTQAQITEISEFADPGSRYYIEDVDQDGTKDIIVERVRGTMNCHQFLYYHANNDKTFAKIEGPNTSEYEDEGSICWNTSLGFIQLNNKTYPAIVDNFLDYAAASQPKTIIELFSLKDNKSRNGLGKIQINYQSQFQGNLIKGAVPSFHFLVDNIDPIVRHFSQSGSPPLAKSLMNTPDWTYTNKIAEKTVEGIEKKYSSRNFMKNDSQYQLLDIDNDGKKEMVCHLVYEAGFKCKFSRMIIIEISIHGQESYIDVDKSFPQMRSIDDPLLDTSYNTFDQLEHKGSEYFPLSDGKENYIVKIGKGLFGWRESAGFILGVYKLKNKKIELVDAMLIEPQFVLTDVKVLN